MQSTRLLPPQFLLPSWTPLQLIQLAHPPHQRQQRRGYHNPKDSSKKPESTNTPLDPSISNKKPTPSLFETLFPEDAYAKKRSERRLDKLPAFKWHVDLPPTPSGTTSHRRDKVVEPFSGSLKGLRKKSVFGGEGSKTVEKTPTVLLLSALTKTLEESDFFRLSPKGEHIEGWTSGIIKVIQARDTHTLAPLSFYFILFTTPLACTQYRDNLLRLHSLSQVRGFISKSVIPLPPNDLLKPNEDIDTLLRGFSLVPPSGRLSMRILKPPFTPFIHNMVTQGMHAALSTQSQTTKESSKSEAATVLLVTSTGRYTEADILDAIQKDVRRRNLEWKLAGGKRDIERLNERVVGKGEEEEEELWAQEGKVKSLQGQARFRSRFVIAFRDRHEARRFVREWHRMPLPLGAMRKREAPVVDVQMLW